MTVLVTGGAGFVGTHIAEALATVPGHQRESVRVLDNFSATGGAAAYPDWVEVVSGDVRDPDTVARCLDGVSSVCHQAAMVGLGVDLTDMPGYVDVNAGGTAVLLAAMARAGVSRLVLASSMVVYGEGAYTCLWHGGARPGPRARPDLAAGRFEPPCPHCGMQLAHATVDEAAPLDPRNTYATTKLTQEHLAATWARETGGLAVALRYHNVYGPRMPRDTPYAGVAAIFRSALAHGEPPRVFEDGHQLRDFVHVRDVARANARALEANLPHGQLHAYNIASGQPRSVGDMAEALADAYGGPQPVVTGAYRLGDVRHIVAAPELAASELNFTAEVPFEQGMKEFATELQPS